MPSKRIARVNEQIRRELTFLLQREVRDPRIGVITITDVEVSPDLYHAKVFYSVMGDEDERTSAAEGLRAAAGYLRTEIGRRMHIRRAPELHFSYDDTQRHAMHIERLLQEALATAATTDGDAADQDDPEQDDPGAEDGGDAGVSGEDNATEVNQDHADEDDARRQTDGGVARMDREGGADDGEHGRA